MGRALDAATLARLARSGHEPRAPCDEWAPFLFNKWRLTGQKEESVVLVTSFCLTQLNAQIACEVATTWNAALVQPAALQGDVEGVGHLVECVRLIIIAWVV